MGVMIRGGSGKVLSVRLRGASSYPRGRVGERRASRPSRGSCKPPKFSAKKIGSEVQGSIAKEGRGPGQGTSRMRSVVTGAVGSMSV